MIVVSDTTPLISLMKASRLKILKELFGEVLIPDAVFKELTDNPRFQAEADLIRHCGYIKTIAVRNYASVTGLLHVSGLDLGETEAIICAKENKADILLMDEAAGRRTAKSEGLSVMGTVGILLAAYDENILDADSVTKALESLKHADRHISRNLFEIALTHIKDKTD